MKPIPELANQFGENIKVTVSWKTVQEAQSCKKKKKKKKTKNKNKKKNTGFQAAKVFGQRIFNYLDEGLSTNSSGNQKQQLIQKHLDSNQQPPSPGNFPPGNS